MSMETDKKNIKVILFHSEKKKQFEKMSYQKNISKETDKININGNFISFW